jgi:hypothetical protein
MHCLGTAAACAAHAHNIRIGLVAIGNQRSQNTAKASSGKEIADFLWHRATNRCAVQGKGRQAQIVTNGDRDRACKQIAAQL